MFAPMFAPMGGPVAGVDPVRAGRVGYSSSSRPPPPPAPSVPALR